MKQSCFGPVLGFGATAAFIFSAIAAPLGHETRFASQPTKPGTIRHPSEVGVENLSGAEYQSVKNKHWTNGLAHSLAGDLRDLASEDAEDANVKLDMTAPVDDVFKIVMRPARNQLDSAADGSSTSPSIVAPINGHLTRYLSQDPASLGNTMARNHLGNERPALQIRHIAWPSHYPVNSPEYIRQMSGHSVSQAPGMPFQRSLQALPVLVRAPLNQFGNEGPAVTMRRLIAGPSHYPVDPSVYVSQMSGPQRPQAHPFRSTQFSPVQGEFQPPETQDLISHLEKPIVTRDLLSRLEKPIVTNTDGGRASVARYRQRLDQGSPRPETGSSSTVDTKRKRVAEQRAERADSQESSTDRPRPSQRNQ